MSELTEVKHGFLEIIDALFTRMSRLEQALEQACDGWQRQYDRDTSECPRKTIEALRQIGKDWGR
jgi:hypothetical protein